MIRCVMCSRGRDFTIPQCINCGSDQYHFTSEQLFNSFAVEIFQDNNVWKELGKFEFYQDAQRRRKELREDGFKARVTLVIKRELCNQKLSVVAL